MYLIKKFQPAVLSFFLLAILGLAACGTGKNAGSATLRNRSSDFLLEQMVRKQVNADWFEGRAKLGYSDEYMSVGATATMRMRKDSILWFSIKKLGFEAVRVLITPDSVYLLDRLNNQYAIEPLNWLEKNYNLPANLRTLQMIFLGNPVFFGSGKLLADVDQQEYRLFNRQEGLESNYWLNGKDFSLRKMSFNDQRYDRSFQYELLEYQPIKNKQNFSYFRNIAVESKETGKANLEIKFSEVELNVPKSIQFEIPKKYTRMDLD